MHAPTLPISLRARVFAKLLHAAAQPAVWCAFVLAALPPITRTPFGNQHTYLLHGLAQTRAGLARDWLAHTTDPMPVFSALIAALDSIGALFVVDWLQLLACWLFAYSLLELGFETTSQDRSWRQLKQLCLTAALVLLMAGGKAQPPLGGLASQYALGLVFQPSSAGVLFLPALICIDRKHPLGAIALSCAAAAIHPTYMLMAVAVCTGALLNLQTPGSLRTHLIAVGLGAAGLLPILGYEALALRPTSSSSIQRATEILADIRIPYHAQPSVWCDAVAVTHAVVAAVGIVLARRRRFAPTLGLLMGLAWVGTGVVSASHSDSWALLFPWRTSVVWIPVGYCLLFARVIEALSSWVERHQPVLTRLWHRIQWPVLVTGIAGAVALRALLHPLVDGLGPLYAAAKKRAAADPTALSTNSVIAVLPPKLSESVRLGLERAVYVDWKSHPFKDTEVLEWWRRIQLAQTASPSASCATLRPLVDEGVDHLLVRSDWSFGALDPYLSIVAEGGGAKLAKISPAITECKP